ncbi:serine hydrolase [Streptomyces sp. NPDC016562]|uniref:D-alanyl-D-alanine carboxypeptidase n=1 Tax=Streptomyces sp. NPDC016562 TaxID=3364966 RepID=UPI003700EDA1
MEPARAEPQASAEVSDAKSDAEPDGDTARTAAQTAAEPADDATVAADATAQTPPDAPPTEADAEPMPDAEAPDSEATEEPDQAEPDGDTADTAAQTSAEAAPDVEADAEAPDSHTPGKPARAEPQAADAPAQASAEAPADEADAEPDGNTAAADAQTPAEAAPDVEADAEAPDSDTPGKHAPAEPQDPDAAPQASAEATEGRADGDTGDTPAQTPAEPADDATVGAGATAQTPPEAPATERKGEPAPEAESEMPDTGTPVEPDQAEPQADDAATQPPAEATEDDAQPDGDTADTAAQTPGAHTPAKAIRGEPEAVDTTAGAPAGAAGKSARPAPSWARGGEAEDERTSRFVRLRGLDADAPAAAPAQAVPPTAPLDLLASLTNSDAAPQSPRRTALRRVKVWTPVLLLLAGAYTGAQLLRPLPTPHIVAAETARTGSVEGQFSIPWPAKGQGAVRISGSGSGDIGTFGEQKPVPTASVAKVMTAYVVLKGHPLRKGEPGAVITVDAKAVADGTSEHESRIVGLTTGTKFSQQDMLKMLMIPSGNNIARLLARWDTNTADETAFVAKMNAAARELGMKDTTYTDPSGLDAGTVSTAADQLKLAEAVMKDEAFRAIVALPNATIKGLPEPLLNNNESLLTAQGLSIRGIKTGSSTPAGGTLMWAAYKSIGDETPLILGTLMEQRVDGPDPDAINSLALVKTNSRKIIEAVRTALASAPVVRKGQTVGYVDDGLGGRTPLVATKDLNVIGVPGQQVKLSLVAGSSPLPHTAKAGSEVAVLTAGDGEGAKSVPVAVRGALAEPSLGTRLTRLG